MTAGFGFATTLSDGSVIYATCMGFATAMCVIALYYLYAKWVGPAFKKETAIELNDKTLELNTRKMSIPWTDIETITYKSAEYGSIIGIKIKDIEAFLNNSGKRGKIWQYKLNYSFYRHHIGISTLLIKGDGNKTYEAINDFFNRYRLGAPAFFHERKQM
jgi:hypothetical protein